MALASLSGMGTLEINISTLRYLKTFVDHKFSKHF